ncbi:MAG: aminoacyl-tRNA hydrolase [Candidatus Pacebacteria bacterium]|nr:aminoacyl-tRNA hydrolase [Candidatus Paceibacterota bacterium]
MILIVGLGNPEEKYENTPHNVGFRVIDLFKEKFDFPNFSLNQNSLISKKENIILLKPQTYMNNSGVSVKEIMNFYKIRKEDLWVIHDENDLKLGEFKISKNISPKGHNGIKSIIEKLGTQDFIRFRVGINSNQKEDLIDYVLKPFSKENTEIINETIFDVVSSLNDSIINGIKINK